MLADAAGAVLTVDLAALVANWRLLCSLHPSGPVAGVVKGDGYGLGAAPIAEALFAAGCRHFFVALPQEAMAIRRRVPGAMVAVLSGLIPGTEDAFIVRDITPVLGSLAEIDAWTAAGKRAGVRLPAILHVDTGMARLGLDQTAWHAVCQDPLRLAGIEVHYLLSHLVSSEVPTDPTNETQRTRFASIRSAFPGIPGSFANSSGIFLGPGWGSDLARPGAALYGINPTPDRPNPMRPVVALHARILSIRDIPAGTAVGYNATWTATRPTRIATAAIGYADGLHRAVSGKLTGFFDGTPIPLVGRVSMDLTTFDVTDCPAAEAGGWIEIIGPSQSPDAVAAVAGTNGYEVLTSLAPRLRRVYKPA